MSTTEVGPSSATVRRAVPSPIVASLRFIAFLGCTAWALSGVLIGRFLARTVNAKRFAATYWTRQWFLGGRHVLGMKVRVSGPMPPPGVLLAPNHAGYIDMIALGSIVNTFFVAKLEIESWPVIGYLLRVSETVGVPRSKTRGLIVAIEGVAERLRGGHRVCVFLESTTTGGEELLPFRGAMLQAALDANAPIVPVGIQYRLTRPDMDFAEDVAYWKTDHVFGPHFWRLIGLGNLDAEIVFGEPILPATQDRAALADQIRERVIELRRSVPSA